MALPWASALCWAAAMAVIFAGATTAGASWSLLAVVGYGVLSATVQGNLGFVRVAGRPRIWSFRAWFRGRFWLRRGLGWMPAEAWQYNSAPQVARVLVMRVRAGGAMPMVGYDAYLSGRGRMIGKPFDRLTVVDGRGEEFDVGELTTYLNDAVSERRRR